MKPLLVLLLLSTVMLAQVKTTVTAGVIQDTTGNPATSGYVQFDLQPTSSGLNYSVPGIGAISTTGQCTINGSGQLVACGVWGTGVIVPANTTYCATYFPSGVQTQRVCQLNITGTSFDLTRPVFAPIATIIPQYNTITTSPIAANIVPAANSVFTLGNAAAHYAQAWIDNLMGGASLQITNLNSIRFADQFNGADCGAKINAADANLGVAAGEIWVNQACGTTWTTTVTLTNGHRVRIIQGASYTSGASPMVNLASSGSGIDCGGEFTGLLITSNATANIVETNGSFWSVSNCGFRSSVLRTGGAGLRVKSGNGHAEHLRFDTTHNGIQIIDANAFGVFEDVQMGNGLSATGGDWVCGIEVGGVAIFTVTGNHFNNIHINEAQRFTDAAICIYDGSDATMFTNFDVGQFPGSPSTALHVGRKAGGLLPEWTRFTNGHLEADSTSVNTLIDEARDIQFVNVAFQNGLQGIWFKTACIACKVVAGEMLQFQHEAIEMDIGAEIIGVSIGDAGQAADNTYDTIHVKAGVGSFGLHNIVFADLTQSPPTNTARYSVYIEAGSSNFYFLDNLFYGQAHSTLFDGGSGSSKQSCMNGDVNIPCQLFNGMRPSNSVAPSCTSAERGTFWYQPGGAGVKDIVQVCGKDVADAYAWRSIY